MADGPKSGGIGRLDDVVAAHRALPFSMQVTNLHGFDVVVKSGKTLPHCSRSREITVIPSAHFSLAFWSAAVVRRFTNALANEIRFIGVIRG